MKQPVKDAITMLVILAVFGISLAAWGHIVALAASIMGGIQ